MIILRNKFFGYVEEFINNLNLNPQIISDIINDIGNKNYLTLISDVGKILLSSIISVKRYRNRLKESNITNSEYNRCRKDLPPEYFKLEKLKNIVENIILENNFTEDFKKVYRSSSIPGYMNLLSIEKIAEYRKDSIKNRRDDYSEILFMFGGKLVFGYNFSEQYWFIRSKTKNIDKAWKIKSGNFWKAITYTFNTFNKHKLNYGTISEELSQDLDCYINILKTETKKLNPNM